MPENSIQNQIEKFEHSHAKDLKINAALEIIYILQHLDKDLSPLLETINFLLKTIPSDRDRGLAIKKILDFYGLGTETNILKIRQKIDVIKGNMIKRPFIKPKDKISINSLIQDLDIL